MLDKFVVVIKFGGRVISQYWACAFLLPY